MNGGSQQKITTCNCILQLWMVVPNRK